MLSSKIRLTKRAANMATSRRKYNKRTREKKGIQKAFLAAELQLFSCYVGSKSTYACQHVLAGWLNGRFLLTEDLSTHHRPLISWTCVAPNLQGLNTFSCCNANGFHMILCAEDKC